MKAHDIAYLCIITLRTPIRALVLLFVRFDFFADECVYFDTFLIFVIKNQTHLHKIYYKLSDCLCVGLCVGLCVTELLPYEGSNLNK